jgi:hypothetical protein
VLSDVAGFAFVTRGKDYHLLDHPLIQARLHLPPDQLKPRPESQMVRSLYDCPEIPVGPDGVRCRVVVATHPAGKKKSPIGVTRASIVYELFFTNLPQRAFTATDVRSAVFASWRRTRLLWLMKTRKSTRIVGAVTRPGDRSAGNWFPNGCGTSAWNWDISFILIRSARPNLHLLFLLLHHTQLLLRAPLPLMWACAGRAGRFSGQDFALQADGTLRCQASQKLIPHEQRREADGSLRIVYGGSHRSCRPCPLREQWRVRRVAPPRSRAR